MVVFSLYEDNTIFLFQRTCSMNKLHHIFFKDTDDLLSIL